MVAINASDLHNTVHGVGAFRYVCCVDDVLEYLFKLYVFSFIETAVDSCLACCLSHCCLLAVCGILSWSSVHAERWNRLRVLPGAELPAITGVPGGG